MKPPATSSTSINITRKTQLFSHQLFILLAFILFAIFLYGQNIGGYIAGQNYRSINQSPSSSTTEEYYKRLPFSIGKTEDGCDVFSGKWEWDPSGRPSYQEPECPYIQPQLTCQGHGRPDRDYQFWRWQPHGCSIPRMEFDDLFKTLQEIMELEQVLTEKLTRLAEKVDNVQTALRELKDRVDQLYNKPKDTKYLLMPHEMFKK